MTPPRIDWYMGSLRVALCVVSQDYAVGSMPIPMHVFFCPRLAIKRKSAVITLLIPFPD